MRWAVFLRSLPLWLACAGVWAQAAGGPPASLQLERDRIAAERKRIDQRFAAEQVACQQRFAVSGCVETARSAQRSARDELRRQEVLLNDGERRRKAAEQQQRLDEKERARAADGAARSTRPAQEPGAVAPPHGRLPGDVKTRPSHADQTAEYQEMMRRKQQAHQEDNARRAAQAGRVGGEEQRYADKQREAADYKARVLGRRAEPSQAKPLPAPP